MPARAVLYLRLSAVSDDSTSIVRQEADLRALAARRGWVVEAVLVDEGISGRKARAKAEEAVGMLADGRADVLAVWKLDRFTRQGWDGLGGVSRALDARARTDRPALFVALQDGLDSDQAAFRLIAGVLSEVARTEADNGATRARNALHYRKTVSDRFAGGSTIPFGYRSVPAPDGVGRVLVLDEVEAAVVRDVAERILSGHESLSSISRDLTGRVPTSKSEARRAARRGDPTEGLDRGRWPVSTIVSLWTADSLLGRVRHRGALVRDEAGLPRAVWPPVLDLATVERLRARLRPTAPRPRRLKAARLLSGLAFCQSCGARLYVSTSSARSQYACGTGWNGGYCPGPKIDADLLDAHVSDLFLSVAGSAPERVVEESVAPSTASAELREVEAALREASAAMLDDDADLAALSGRIASLRDRRTSLRAVPSTVSSVLVETGRTLADAWHDALSLDERRALLLTALDHVAVAPGRNRWDAGRVSVAWVS